jgi:adenylylsulfate kinase
MKNYSNKCFWITGLSASGKTTLSTIFVDYLRKKKISVIHFDGDDLRKIFSDYGNTKINRLNRAKKFSKLCKLITSQGVTVVIGIIGLSHELQKWNRDNIENYIEIFLNVPMSELVKRDPKGIYKKSKEGKIKNVAGVDFVVEFPINPDIVLEWIKNEHPIDTFERLQKKISQINYYN